MIPVRNLEKKKEISELKATLEALGTLQAETRACC